MAAGTVIVYRLLLRAFPASFRDRFGKDMTDVFADRLREARHTGRFAVAVLWLRSVADIAAHATAERRVAHATATRSGGYMSGVGSDVVTALRGLIRRPGFTLAIGLMLAVGLGFNTALFAVVQSVLLRPLPYVKPDRIMMLWTGRNPDGTGSVNSYADYLAWKEQSHSFESLATYNISFATLTDAGDPEEIGGSVVSPEFFHVLRVPLALGRGIEPGDEVVPPDAGRPIVIAHGLWQRRFHGDPAIVGKTLTLAGRQRRIVGVVAHEFIHPEPFWGELAEYWSPLTVTDSMRTAHGNHYLRVIGRLADGATPASARAEMDQIGRELMKTYPTTNTASVVVASLQDELIGDTRPLLWMFFGALVLVLSLAVANIVNLLLARTSRRRAELLIRSALGASRGRLMTQLIIESVMMGLVGGVMGLAFAEIGIRLLVAYGTISAPGIENTRIDAAVIVFAILLSTVTGAICGLVPAWRVGRVRFSSSLGDMRGSAGLEVSRARTWLVAGEMALALPLLVGAALLTQTLIREQRVDPGFDAAHALQFRVTLADTRYQELGEGRVFRAAHVEAGRAAGREERGHRDEPAARRSQQHGRDVRLRSRGRHAGRARYGLSSGHAGYFAALNVPLRRGRLFTDADADKSSVVVNERAAQAMWGAEADRPAREVRPAGGFAGQGHLAHGGRGCRRPASRDAGPPAES